MEQFVRSALKKVHPGRYACTSLLCGLCCVDVSESPGLVLVSSLSSYIPSELKIIHEKINDPRVGLYSRLVRITILLSRDAWLKTFLHNAKRDQTPANIHIMKNVAVEWSETNCLPQIYGRNQKNKNHLYYLPL